MAVTPHRLHLALASLDQGEEQLAHVHTLLTALSHADLGEVNRERLIAARAHLRRAEEASFSAKEYIRAARAGR